MKDAIITSMYQNGRVDVEYIANALGKSEDEVKDEIINSGLGFENPITRQIEVSYQYKSGNVREKLRQARGRTLQCQHQGSGECYPYEHSCTLD